MPCRTTAPVSHKSQVQDKTRTEYGPHRARIAWETHNRRYVEREDVVEKIAAEIGRHRSTVFREIKRNRFIDDELPKLNGYYGMTAQRTAVRRQSRRRKLVRFVDLRKQVSRRTGGQHPGNKLRHAAIRGRGGD